jgi:hypothetical protein
MPRWPASSSSRIYAGRLFADNPRWPQRSNFFNAIQYITSGLRPRQNYSDASQTAASQRKLPIANGSFLEAQLQSIDDPSAVIHYGQHRARCGRLLRSEAKINPGTIQFPWSVRVAFAYQASAC